MIIILFFANIFIGIILVLVVLFILIYAATNNDNDYSDAIDQPKSFSDRIEIKRVGNVRKDETQGIQKQNF